MAGSRPAMESEGRSRGSMRGLIAFLAFPLAEFKQTHFAA